MNNRPSLNRPLSDVNRPSLNKPLSEVLAAGPSPDKYESILLAAIRVFARNGFFNAKVADVAREAGVADGTVYLYFKNKEELLTSIFNYTLDEAIALAKVETEAVADPAQKLERLAKLYLRLMGKDRNLAVVFHFELRQPKFIEQFSATKLNEFLDFIVAAVKEGQLGGSFREEISPSIAARALYGALAERVIQWILSQDEAPLVDSCGPLIDLFLNGVRR
ncbi:MAG: TetR/AcrR family transcriptional regulator [Acidobacteriota bacterium]|nr:TetR/AcrR family transcriptional regulator [Blastocatellia bacterium]MDW8412852.1 TetR/AcrR family transcriptional regulator [Acidobacteriota bacterium]